LPIILLGSFALGRFLDGVAWRDLWERRAPVFAGAVLLGLLVLIGISGVPNPFRNSVSPLADQRAALSWLGMAAPFVVTFVGRARLGGERGGRRLFQTLGLLGLATAGVFYVRASFMASYQFGDVAREMLIYTQTTPDVTAVMREIDRLSHRTGQGTNFKV